MDYLDKNGNYDQKKVIDGIVKIDTEIQELRTKGVIDESRMTRLMYEQMLRGLYLWNNPYS